VSPHPEDPKWTAFLLGELDAETQQSCKAEMEGDPDLRARVDALAETLQLLREAFQQPVSGSGDMPAACARALAPPVRKPVRFWLPTALAAMLAIGFGLSRYRSQAPKESSFTEAEALAPMDSGGPAGLEAAFDGAVRNAMELEEAPAAFSLPSVTLPAPASAPPPPARLRRSEPMADRMFSALEEEVLPAESEPVPEPTPTPTPTPSPNPPLEFAEED